MAITYNVLNLQQSLSQNGTTVASYTWLADGTKCAVVDNTLYLDASKLDFGNISTSNFQNINETTPVNLLNPGNLASSTCNSRLRATVYAIGCVDMQLKNRSLGTVSIVNNRATDYDWNTGGRQHWSTLINAKRLRTGIGDNHGFRAYYYGYGKLNK